MFRAPFGALTSAGKSSTDSAVRKPTLPLNSGWGIGSTDRFQSGSASLAVTVPVSANNIEILIAIL